MRIPLPALRPFAASGQLYRCFDHVLAAGHGSLLAVPVVNVDGDFRELVDRCPVPYLEALTVIETPITIDLQIRVGSECHSKAVRRLAELDDGEWHLQPAALARGTAAIWLLGASSGIRMGIVPDLAFVTPEVSHA